ncbi:hypothetical protein EhV145_00349 [Emiliania huxleyi virus 145]|nr:hypothetical protein EhV145_00349 [Emiliania huxleyi virus 145]AHA55911.1 hypothetical protein EhV164_00324 [Emiliania huxleyi virus 164]
MVYEDMNKLYLTVFKESSDKDPAVCQCVL